MTTPQGPGGPPPPGWYADPAGVLGRYRFWDGVRWTDRTSLTSAGEDVGRSARSGRGWLAAGALVVVIVLVAGFLLLRQGSGGTVADPLPTSTVVGGDDSSPTRTPEESPSATPDAGDIPSTDNPSVRPTECDTSRPNTLPAPKTDGRVHGGSLSFARLGPPWSAPTATPRFPFSSDSYVQTLRLDEELGWQASAQVGLAVVDDGTGSGAAAQTMLTCLLMSTFYSGVDVTLAENTTTATTVSDTAATQVDALLSFEHPQLTTKGRG